MTTAIVVGGGIAGLVTAWQLVRHGIDVDVFESAPEVGGALASHHVAGLELNSGAEAFSTASDHVFELVEELGLTDALVSPRSAQSWIINVRGAFPAPADSYLGIPANPLADDVVALVGVEAARHAAADAQLRPDEGYHPGISLGEYVTNRMGRAVRGLLVEPVVGGVYSTSPDLLELDTIAPRLFPAVQQHGSLQAAVAALRSPGLRPGTAVASLDPVIDLLPRSLDAEITSAGGRVHTNTTVRGVAEAEDGGWDVTLDGSTAHADLVVLTTPAMVARRLLAQVPHVANSIPVLPTSPIALVTMVVDDERLDDSPRGNGALVASHTPGLVAKALTHATAKWEHVRRAAEESAPGRHRHVLRLSYGRSGDPVPTPTELPELALNDARRMLGVRIRRDSVAAIELTLWGQTMTQARPGHQSALAEVAGRLSTHPGLGLTGAWMAGTGIAAITNHARRVAHFLAGLKPYHPISASAPTLKEQS
ncbi:protoporphyrinogen oxidase [Aestuariimicrobium sp. Y1814]|uniref:protoporphyrinogen oxidase n=1 Tax=Aestuariimicrobium sp. Y1814 TaxID=3418742 RepID=UPI003DA796FC